MQAQANQEPFLETFSLILQDELDRRRSRLMERRYQLSGLDDYWRGDEDDVPPHNNIIGSAVDWFTAVMFRTQIRPFYLTQKGDAKTREKAQARQRACEAHDVRRIGQLRQQFRRHEAADLDLAHARGRGHGRALRD